MSAERMCPYHVFSNKYNGLKYQTQSSEQLVDVTRSKLTGKY